MNKNSETPVELLYVGPHGTFTSGEAGEKPVPKDMPGVKGVFVGGCVSKGVGTRLSEKSSKPYAHAHTDDPDKGWVCFQVPEYLDDKTVRMHELAHITTGQGHTEAWRREMVRLGQQIPKRYQRRQRKASNICEK